MPQRIVDARFKTALLLVVADFQPIFDELNAAFDDESFNLWTKLEEAAVLFFRAKPHHVLHAGAVVPTAIEDHDLARGRKMRDVTLHVHLGFSRSDGAGSRQPERRAG